MDRLATIATIEGLRGVMRSDPDEAIRTAASQRLLELDGPRRLCAWCSTDMGPALSTDHTHGICPPCLARWMRDLDRRRN